MASAPLPAGHSPPPDSSSSLPTANYKEPGIQRSGASSSFATFRFLLSLSPPLCVHARQTFFFSFPLAELRSRLHLSHQSLSAAVPPQQAVKLLRAAPACTHTSQEEKKKRKGGLRAINRTGQSAANKKLLMQRETPPSLLFPRSEEGWGKKKKRNEEDWGNSSGKLANELYSGLHVRKISLPAKNRPVIFHI